MIPTIALVGRPNVGKSTLFNRITKTQNALVADFPGLTRDRKYGSATFGGKSFILVDTGGIGVDDVAVDELMSRQSEIALNEANIVLFIVDARQGLTPVDLSIAEKIRKKNKSIILVVNKIDGLDEVASRFDFDGLGFSAIFCISATHGRGVHELLANLTKDFNSDVAHNEPSDSIKISFIGRPNVGKSTLINRIMGEERVVVYNLPGTTRDSIEIPFEKDNQKYTLIDTAGMRRRARIDEKVEKFSVIKTIQSIKESNVCLMLIDATEGLTDQDMHLLGFIIESGNALVVLVNKWDGLDEEHKEHVKNTLARKLQFVKFAKIKYISALHGSGVGLLFKDINEAYQSSMIDLSTSRLTKLLQEIITQHTPPLVNGRRVKLRFAHAGGHNPPIIVIHGNQVDALPDSYKRYMTNTYSEKLNLVGTPLKIEYKGGDNPFKDKKNKLTERQIKKRARLRRHVKSK
jgi:GTP-binding protein